MCMVRCAGVFAIILIASWLIDTPANSQTLSLRERIFLDPFTELNQAIKIAGASRVGNYGRPQVIAINWCHIYAEWGATRDDDFLEHFEHIAQEHVHMRQLLNAAGYPPEAYRDALATVTIRYLREIERRRKSGLDLRDNAGIKRAVLPFEQRLAAAMNAYREKVNPALARPEVWNECGGDYVGYVKLKALPDGATIRLIREFYFKFCQATGIRPYSDACDKWSVIPSTRDVPGGIYHYLVSWPNGHIECDRIEFSGATPAEDDKIITINRSGKGCVR